MTRDGVNAQPKKLQAIHDIQPPKTRKQLKRFVGMVNCHRGMWQQRSHILPPLNALASPEKQWKWTDKCEVAFAEMKRVVSHETLLTFPDFNQEFHVHTDASDYQLAAVIMQKGKPVAFCSSQNTQCCSKVLHNRRAGVVEHCGNTERIQKHVVWAKGCCAH